MPLELDPQYLEVTGSILKWLGATSVTGFLALYATWISFSPELVVDGVVDKSKKFDSESKLKLKNIGKMPAHTVTYNLYKLNFAFGTNRITNGTAVNITAPSLHRLAGGEVAEVTITPGIYFEDALQLKEFSYILELHYKARLFFLSKKFAKKWTVELRKFDDGFSWSVLPAK